MSSVMSGPWSSQEPASLSMAIRPAPRSAIYTPRCTHRAMPTMLIEATELTVAPLSLRSQTPIYKPPMNPLSLFQSVRSRSWDAASDKRRLYWRAYW